MFVGIQIIDGKEFTTFMGKTRKEVENEPCMIFARIEEVEWAERYKGAVYTDKEELQKAKESFVRSERDRFLTLYIDPVVTNPLRWGDMSAEEQGVYAAYRKYLLAYDKGEGSWWTKEPLTFDEWKKEQKNGMQA